jgi:ATP/maltotriose-dependent transcriptional regulator MalT
VGRERELNALLERMAAAERGDGGVVLISGEPGVGKSRLLAEIAGRARGEGWRVLGGRAYDIEGMPPYLPFVDVLREQFRDLSDDDLTAHVTAISSHLAPLVPGARSVVVKSTRSDSQLEPEVERYRLFESFCGLLLSISRSPPNRGLLLALDDLHWADRSTLLLFLHLARKLADAPLLVVGTYRSAEVAPDRPIFDALAELSRERLHARIHLIGFSLDETRLLLRRLGGVDAASAVLEAIFEQTAGNPFFVEEVVRHLETDGRDLAGQAGDAAGWGIPEGVREVIAKRVLGLSSEASTLLHAAAVLGDDCRGEPLATVAELGGPRLLEGLEELTRAGMLHEEGQRYRFSHPLVQRTIYDGLSLARREILHLKAAMALEGGKMPQLHLSALAVHYRLAGAPGDADKAIDYSMRAGEAANAVFAYDEATSHWRAALAIMQERGAPPLRTADVLERLGDLLCVTSLDQQKGIEYLERSLSIYSRNDRVDAAALVHLRLGRHLSTFYDAMDIDGAREHFRAAELVLAQLGEAARLSIYTGIASTAMWNVRTAEGLEASQRAMDLAPPNEAEFAHALALHAWHVAAAGRLAEAHELGARASQMADRLDDPVVAVIVDWLRAQLRYLLGDPTESARWFERQLSKPWLAQAPLQRRRLVSMLAWVRAFSGGLAEARRLLYEGDRSAPPERWADAGLKFWSGDWEQARTLLAEDAEERRRNGDRHSAADDLWLLGRVQVSLGEMKQAEASFEESLALSQGHLLLEMRARAELALLCAETGRTAEARQHVERCEVVLSKGEDWRGVGGRIAIAEGALASAEGRSQDAETHLGRAIEIFRRVTLPWDEAEGLRLWGRYLAHAHRRDEARTRLTESLDMYIKLGGGPAWTDPVAAERDALVKRSTANGAASVYPDGLSGREVDVLRLIAGGKSNREIADQLFVSARTVERHIANIYGKIEVHSRTQATAYAFAHDLLSAPGTLRTT